MNQNMIGETEALTPSPSDPSGEPADAQALSSRTDAEAVGDSAPGGSDPRGIPSHDPGAVHDRGPDEESDDWDDDDEDEFIDMDVKPLEEIASDDIKPEEHERQWYILKVQSNRENSICDALRRQVAIRGLSDYFGDILVPTEDVAEFKNGKRRVVKRKLYPGYIVVNMALTEETWFVVRETPGIGDFTGAAGKPSPMLPEEIAPILRTIYPPEEGTESIKTAIPFKLGDRVRIRDNTFENFEGDVETIDEANGRVTVIINIFGRSTPVELEHWQIEAL